MLRGIDWVSPQHPNHEAGHRELSAQQPGIAKALRAKLDTWLATLKPPGPPKPLLREGGFINAKLLPGKTATQ